MSERGRGGFGYLCLFLGGLWLGACGDSAAEPGASGSPGSGGAGARTGSGGDGAQGGSLGSGTGASSGQSGGGGSGAATGSSGGGGSKAGSGNAGRGGTGNDAGDGGEGGTGEPSPIITECNDGIDNDGDGYVDWQSDLGCWGPGDTTESARPRAEENGFTTFEIGPDSKVVYVSAEGDDNADGATPETAVKTLTRAASLVRDGQHDFILLRRGDTWRGQSLQRFKSGKDAEHPLVIASYGDSKKLPRIEVSGFFINHDGQARNYVALVGLHFVLYPNDPSDPGFTGTAEGPLRYVGGGKNLLIESCHFEYGSIIVQSLGANHYEDVEVRRNVIEKAYRADKCDQVGPSGIYSSHVDGLTIEGNLLDHNGWHEDVEGACATIFNHNLYLNAHRLTVRDNILSRASSISIKLRSDTEGDMRGTLIENNYIVEGEVGISIGGNAEVPGRFVSSVIRNNVFSDIGRSQPTGRTLAWALDIIDNDELEVSGNYFLNQHKPGVSNSYAISLSRELNDISITKNLFYRVQGKNLVTSGTAGHKNVEISGNTFVDPSMKACLIDHSGTFAGYTYSENRYYSSANANSWFCGSGGSLDGWKSASGESDAQTAQPTGFADPERSVETYAESLGLEPTLAAFIEAARLKHRLEYDPRFTANALNDYIRAGFKK